MKNDVFSFSNWNPHKLKEFAICENRNVIGIDMRIENEKNVWKIENVDSFLTKTFDFNVKKNKMFFFLKIFATLVLHAHEELDKKHDI